MTKPMEEIVQEKKEVAKKRAALRQGRKMQFIAGIEDHPIRDALAVSKEGTKKAVDRMEQEGKREKLDLWIEQVFGRRAHPEQGIEVLAKALRLWINGEIDEKGSPTKKGKALSRLAVEEAKANTHTIKEGTDMGKTAKKIEPSKETKGKKGKKGKVAEAAAKPPAEGKAGKKGKGKGKDSKRILGATSGLTRAAWFEKVLKENTDKKLTDEKILALAKAEFPSPEAIIGEKCWKPATIRGWINSGFRKGLHTDLKAELVRYE